LSLAADIHFSSILNFKESSGLRAVKEAKWSQFNSVKDNGLRRLRWLFNKAKSS
jgi:hypothetical protein